VKNRRDDEKQTSYVPMGICLGIAIGTAIGNITDHNAIWMPIGMCLGMCIAGLIDAKNRRDSRNTEQADEEDTE